MHRWHHSAGYNLLTLQKQPHLVLLSRAWYDKNLLRQVTCSSCFGFWSHVSSSSTEASSRLAGVLDHHKTRGWFSLWRVLHLEKYRFESGLMKTGWGGFPRHIPLHLCSLQSLPVCNLTWLHVHRSAKYCFASGREIPKRCGVQGCLWVPLHGLGGSSEVTCEV